MNEPVIPELDGKSISKAVDSIDFSHVANVRFYVVGPVDDGKPDPWVDGLPMNTNVGNYWFHADTFPLNRYLINENDVHWRTMYMHQNKKLDYNPQTENEGFTIFIHDPDDPILTIGGANMIVDLPDGHRSTVKRDRRSQGQINFADPRWKHTSLERSGVVSFTTDILRDTLCVIGFPVVKLYAKTNPGGEVSGPTDTDFFVRILDVYPDGREFFVVEGCVNARAREYAAALAEVDGFETDEIDNIPFKNINIGEILEYHFRLMPIAYTWGYGHKMKILISSSNHNRYQVNPNLPINDLDFFRRQPQDGQTYIFIDPVKGPVEMEPRIAVQRIAHSPEYPTQIMLPIYDKTFTSVEEKPLPQPASELSVVLYPNPASEVLNVYLSKPNQDHDLTMFNELGQDVFNTTFSNELQMDATRFGKGIYIVRVRDNKTKETFTSKVTIQ